MKSVQNQLISHEISFFSINRLFFGELSLENFPWKSRKIDKFFCESVSENPVKFDFFSRRPNRSHVY